MTQRTNLNKLNYSAICSQISQHGERVEYCDTCIFDVLNSFMKNLLMTQSSNYYY